MRAKKLNGRNDVLYFNDHGPEVYASLKSIDSVVGVGRSDKEAAKDLANELRLRAQEVEDV